MLTNPKTAAEASRYIEEVERAIAGYQFDRNIADIDRECAPLAARAAVDDGEAKADLHLLVVERRRLVDRQHERASLEQQLRTLRGQHADLEAEERRHIVAKADARLDAAKAEFVRAAKAFIASYRNMENVARMNQNIPGANGGTLPMDLRGVLIPHGYQGSLADIVRNGLLPYEVREQEEAADAAKWEKAA